MPLPHRFPQSGPPNPPISPAPGVYEICPGSAREYSIRDFGKSDIRVDSLVFKLCSLVFDLYSLVFNLYYVILFNLYSLLFTVYSIVFNAYSLVSPAPGVYDPYPCVYEMKMENKVRLELEYFRSPGVSFAHAYREQHHQQRGGGDGAVRAGRQKLLAVVVVGDGDHVLHKLDDGVVGHLLLRDFLQGRGSHLRRIHSIRGAFREGSIVYSEIISAGRHDEHSVKKPNAEDKRENYFGFH